MKKLLVVMVMLLPLTTFAQNTEDEKKQTKFEEFSSKTGSIIKFVDVKMPKIIFSILGSLDASIRIFKSENNVYFYRLEKPETSSSTEKIAMIEYSDLVEINKALTKLASEVDSDIATNPDYLENFFRTVDGFQVGYYVRKGEANWYIKLERYSNSTVYIKNQKVVIDAFKNAQAKIEKLKAVSK